MDSEIIDSSTPGIVATEVNVKLSDEKLRSTLQKAYEEAQKNERKINYYDSCSILLSIAGTLFLSLLTSSFHDVGGIKADRITNVAWFICIFSCIMGFFFLFKKYTYRVNGDTDQRDKTVDRIINDQFSNKSKENMEK